MKRKGLHREADQRADDDLRRELHRLLVDAALREAGLLPEPPPRVLHTEARR